MKIAWILLSALLLGGQIVACSSSESPAPYPEILNEVQCVPPETPRPLTYWDDFIAGYEASDRENPPALGSVVLTGSSSVLFWSSSASDLAPLPTLNRGFGGSVLVEATHYADRIVLPYEPSAIVLYSGDNDIGSGGSADCVLRDFEAFAEKIHASAPDTPIYILAIKPSILRRALWPEMARANEFLAAKAETDERLTFVDVASPMLDEDGEPRAELFVADGLHMNADGYELWTSILKPQLLRDLPVTD